jgi:hypothetical protein
MQNEDQQPAPKPATSGGMKPPRPPYGTVIATGFGDDEPKPNRQPRKETVRINLPPKPTAAPTIKLPKPPKGNK